MGKYAGILSDVFSIFNSVGWKANNLKTVPSNFQHAGSSELVRVTVLAGGQGINRVSTSGVLMIDIFTSAGDGPKRASEIADKLDEFLVSKSVNTESYATTQFSQSSLSSVGVDGENPGLFRSSYSIPFQYFGVL